MKTTLQIIFILIAKTSLCTTMIFENYSEFKNRKDKSINGVSRIYASQKLIIGGVQSSSTIDFETDNLTNKGCWNCFNCQNCIGCRDCSFSNSSYCCDGSTLLNNCYDCYDCYSCNDCSNCISLFYGFNLEGYFSFTLLTPCMLGNYDKYTFNKEDCLNK